MNRRSPRRAAAWGRRGRRALTAVLACLLCMVWAGYAQGRDRKNNDLAEACVETDPGPPPQNNPIPCPQFIEMEPSDAGRGQASETFYIRGNAFEESVIPSNSITLQNCRDGGLVETITLTHQDITIGSSGDQTYGGQLPRTMIRLPSAAVLQSTAWWGSGPNDTTQDGYCDMIIPVGGRNYRFPYAYNRDRTPPSMTHDTFKSAQPVPTAGGHVKIQLHMWNSEFLFHDPDGPCTDGMNGLSCNRTAQFRELRVADHKTPNNPFIVTYDHTLAQTSTPLTYADREPEICPVFRARDKAGNMSEQYRSNHHCSGYGGASACNSDSRCYWSGAPFNACYDNKCFRPDGADTSYEVEYYFQHNSLTGVFSDPIPTDDDGVPVFNRYESRSSEPVPDRIIHLKVIPSEPLFDCTPSTTDARFAYGGDFFFYSRNNYAMIPGDGRDNDGDGLIDEEFGGFDGIDNDGDGLIDEDVSGDVNYCLRRTCQQNEVFDELTQTCFWRYPMITIEGPDPSIATENTRLALLSTSPTTYYHHIDISQADVDYDFEVSIKAMDAVGNPPLASLDYVAPSAGAFFRVNNTPSTYGAFYYLDAGLGNNLIVTAPSGVPGARDCDGLDNDGDGRVDEELYDSTDNDYDGLIDEDYCARLPIIRARDIYIKVAASSRQIVNPTVKIIRPGTMGAVELATTPVGGSETAFTASWTVEPHSSLGGEWTNPYDVIQALADGVVNIEVSGINVAGNESGFVSPERSDASYPSFRVDTAPPRIDGDDVCYWVTGVGCGYFCSQYGGQADCEEADNCAWDSVANVCYPGCAAEYAPSCSVYADQASCDADCQCYWDAGGGLCGRRCDQHISQNACEGLRYDYPGFGEIAYDQFGRPTETPRLLWTMNDPDATSYHLQIAEDESFSAPLVRDVQVANAQYYTGILDQGKYYWRVKTRDVLGNFSDYKLECTPRYPTPCEFIVNTDIPDFTVGLYSNQAMTEPLPVNRDGIRVARDFAGAHDDDYLYVRIASSKVLQQPPTFSLTQQGFNDLKNQPTTAISASEYYGRVVINVDNGGSDRDGSAYIRVSGVDEAGNSVNDATPVEGTGDLRIDTQPPEAIQFWFTPDPAVMGANAISLISNEELQTPVIAEAVISCLYGGSVRSVSLSQPVTTENAYIGYYEVTEKADCTGGTVTAFMYDVAGHSSTVQTGFGVDTAPPGVPALISPVNIPVGNAPSPDRSPVFQWSVPPEDGAVRYRFQLAENEEFTRLVKNDDQLTTMSYALANPICIVSDLAPGCVWPGGACAADADCCGVNYGATCEEDVCVAPDCEIAGGDCAEDQDCCGYDQDKGYCEMDPLPDNEYWWRVSATDDSGNESDFSETRRYWIDTLPPDPPMFLNLRDIGGSSISGGRTGGGFIVFDLLCSTDGDPDEYSTVEFFINGDSVTVMRWSSATNTCATESDLNKVDGDGVGENLCLQLTEGSNLLTAKVTDWAGNRGETGGDTTVEYDSGAPVFEVHYYLENPNIFQNPEGVRINSAGTPMLAEGAVYFRFISDKPLKEPPKYSIFQGGTVDYLDITAEPIDGDAANRRFWSSYEVNAHDGTAYQDGDALITIAAEDEIGNKCPGPGQASCSINAGGKFVIDTQPPNVQVQYFVDANLIARLPQNVELERVANERDIYMRFVFTEELRQTPTFNVSQQGTNDAMNLPTTRVQNSWTTFAGVYSVNSHDGSANRDGLAAITANAMDVAGNSISDLVPLTGAQFRIDTTAPSPPVLQTESLETNYNQVEIFGTTEPYAKLTVYVKYSPTSGIQCNTYSENQCSWYVSCEWSEDDSRCKALPPTLYWTGSANREGRFSVLVTLGPATNTVWGTVADVAGNISAESAPFEIVNLAPVAFNFNFVLNTAGWNLISIPFQGYMSSPLTSLGLANNPLYSVGVYGDIVVAGRLGASEPNRYFYGPDIAVMTPGQGYWVYVESPPVARQISVFKSLQNTVTLVPGWNIFGAPYNEDVSWDSTVQVRRRGSGYAPVDLDSAEAQSLVRLPIYRYNPTGSTLEEQWVEVEYGAYTLKPFQGFVIRALENAELVFPAAPED